MFSLDGPPLSLEDACLHAAKITSADVVTWNHETCYSQAG